MDEWKDISMNGWMNEWMDKLMDGWMNGWTIDVHIGVFLSKIFGAHGVCIVSGDWQ